MLDFERTALFCDQNFSRKRKYAFWRSSPRWKRKSLKNKVAELDVLNLASPRIAWSFLKSLWFQSSQLEIFPSRIQGLFNNFRWNQCIVSQNMSVLPSDNCTNIVTLCRRKHVVKYVQLLYVQNSLSTSKVDLYTTEVVSGIKYFDCYSSAKSEIRSESGCSQSDDFGDAEVNKLLIVTQSKQTAPKLSAAQQPSYVKKHMGYDRSSSGQYHSRAKVMSAWAEVINDGLYFYEQNLRSVDDYHHYVSDVFIIRVFPYTVKRRLSSLIEWSMRASMRSINMLFFRIFNRTLFINSLLRSLVFAIEWKTLFYRPLGCRENCMKRTKWTISPLTAARGR